MKVIRFILRNLDQYRTAFIFVALACMADGVAVFLIPVTLAQFADGAITTDSAVRVCATVALLYGLSLLFAYIVRSRGEALAFKFSDHVRMKYFRELSNLPLAKLRKHHSGYIQSLVNKAGDDLSQILFSIFWALLPGILVTVLFFVYIARESIGLAVFNLFVLVAFLGVSTVLSRKIVPLAAEQNRRRASVMGGFADFMANISTVSQLGVQSYAQSVLQARVRRNDAQIDKTQRFHARRWFLLHALYGMAFLATIGFLVWQIQQGQAGVGLLILFVSAYGTMRSLIERLSENIKQFIEVGTYLDELETIKGVTTPAHTSRATWRQLQLSNVALSYEGNAATIRIPELVIKAGDKICIEGKSGQGKSTLLGIITGAVTPDSGQRLVDGVSYEKAGRGFFVKNVATIAQEAELFHMSVRDNLTLGSNVSDQQIISYLHELGMTEWLESLEDGLNSQIGEKGVTLSAGQRQRLNILRAVILNRPIYILDEPTSHLDENTEKIVVAFLKRELADKTLIVVTHRPALRDLCDRYFEMRQHILHPSNQK